MSSRRANRRLAEHLQRHQQEHRRLREPAQRGPPPSSAKQAVSRIFRALARAHATQPEQTRDEPGIKYAKTDVDLARTPVNPEVLGVEVRHAKRTGGCNCGQVRFEVGGEPLRVGFCHCLVCRKETGSVGNFFAVWPSDKISVTGETRSWRQTTDNRHFCATCGSSVFAIVDGANEVEVGVGAFDDAPTDFTPAYELWIPRRERWLDPVDGAEQHTGNRA